MTSRRCVLIFLALAAPAWAQPQPRALYAAKAAKRFPQPVRAGDLIGRDVLEPTERQTGLGRVAALRRAEDGGVDVLIRTGGLLGVGSRLVAVPIEAVALLGEHVALMDLSPAELRALPYAAAPAQAFAQDETIRVGLVRPFH